jgi:beta-N-acetylhexosaminidase
VLLMPADPQAAYSAVLNAVKSGRISESRIDASAARILALKKKYGLFTKKEFGDESLLGCKEHREIVARIKAD